MRRITIVILVAVAAVAVWTVSARRNGGEGPEAAGPGANPQGTAGLVATTGDSDKTDLAVPASPELSTSGEGLVVEPSPVPGGGQMIDLQGRFQHAATATVAGPDSVIVECLPDSGKHGEGDQ